MFSFLKSGFGIHSIIYGIIFLALAGPVSGQVFTTVANGNWNNPGTWAGGLVPNTDEVSPGVIINVNHTVFYDRGTPIKNRGTFRVQRVLPATPAKLTLPTNINVENLAGGSFHIVLATLLQCRFVPCNDGQPYSGINPGAPIQSGTFKNIGGFVEVRGSYVEVAQDWTSESGGIRLMEDSCIFTGQNFSVSGNSDDTLTRVQVSIGWHNSGNFQVSSSTIRFDSVQIQLAGSAGSVQLDSSSRAGGNISYITLRNQIGNFIGSGEIFADPDLKDLSGNDVSNIIDLDAYCVSEPSKYKPNGKFFGTQVQVCDNRFACQTTGPTAGEASIGGRVTTFDGRGIKGIRVTVVGGDLSTPVSTITSPFGYFKIEGLNAGDLYVVSVASKGYTFTNSTRVVSLLDSIADIDFVADAPVIIKQTRTTKR